MTEREIKIRMGIDASDILPGVQGVRKLMERSMKSMTDSLKNMVKINLASQLGGNVMDIWDKGTASFANMVYKVNDLVRGGGPLEKVRQFWRDLRQEIEDSDVAKNKAFKAQADDAMNANMKLAKIDELRGMDRVKVLEKEISLIEERMSLSRMVSGTQLDGKELLDLTVKLEEKKAEVQKIQTAELTKQKDMQQAVLDAGRRGMQQLRDAVALTKANLNSGVRGMSDVSLAEAQSLTEAALGAQNLPALRLSRKQMNDVRRANALQNAAQQARLDGNDLRADQLTNERLGILKRLGFLGDNEKNPLAMQERAAKAAEEQLELAKNNGIAVRVKVVKP